MSWNNLINEQQFQAILESSMQRPQVIFKHSTRCSVSSMVLKRLERSGFHPEIDFHFLDLLAYRPISNLVAEKLAVWHESPQVILINKGEVILEESHLSIQMQEIVQAALANKIS